MVVDAFRDRRPGSIVPADARTDIVPGPCRSDHRPAGDSDADTVAVGVFEGEEPRCRRRRAGPDQLGELLASGEAQRSFKALALAHAEGKRWLTGRARARARTSRPSARAWRPRLARERAREISTRVLCWEVAGGRQPTRSARSPRRSCEGTILADYRFDLHKSAPAAGQSARRQAQAPRRPDRLRGGRDRGGGRRGRDRRRGGQPRPRPAEPARQRPHADGAGRVRARRSARRSTACRSRSRDARASRALGMGAFAAVAQGSEQEPALITLRYEGAGTRQGRCSASSARP